MLHNQAHQIVHASAMYYQNLIIIHECSKKLLKMKNSKSFFKHLVYIWYSMYRGRGFFWKWGGGGGGWQPKRVGPLKLMGFSSFARI